jgi:hypothetical protein
MKIYKRKDFLKLQNVLYMEITNNLNISEISINLNHIFLKLNTVNEDDFYLANIFECSNEYNFKLLNGENCKYKTDDTPSREGCYFDVNDDDLFLVFDNKDIQEIINKLNKVKFNGFSEWLTGESNE